MVLISRAQFSHIVSLSPYLPTSCERERGLHIGTYIPTHHVSPTNHLQATLAKIRRCKFQPLPAVPPSPTFLRLDASRSYPRKSPANLHQPHLPPPLTHTPIYPPVAEAKRRKVGFMSPPPPKKNNGTRIMPPYYEKIEYRHEHVGIPQAARKTPLLLRVHVIRLRVIKKSGKIRVIRMKLSHANDGTDGTISNGQTHGPCKHSNCTMLSPFICRMRYDIDSHARRCKAR